MKKKKKYFLLCLFIMCHLILNNIYSQPITNDLNITSLASQSDLIIRGTVTGCTSSFKEKGRIYSNIKFKVKDHYKGQINKGEEIDFTFLGGTVGNITMFSPEYPQFHLNEESVLFLKKNPSSKNSYYVNELREGKFNIYSDTNGDQMIIRDQFEENELEFSLNNKVLRLSNKKSVPLSSFINYLKSIGQ